MSETKFAASARYIPTGAEFDQARELMNANALSDYNFGKKTTKDTAFGVCLALCVAWISNKLDMTEAFDRGRDERIRTPKARMQWLSLASMSGEAFKQSMATQQKLADAVNRHQWDMTAALRDAAANAPSPIYEVIPDFTGFDSATVIVSTLTLHVPYIMVYRWRDKTGHAIVCYRTKNKTMIFDPNCGEIACPHNEINTMWAAYWTDVKSVFGMPSTCGLAAVGRDPTAIANIVSPAKPAKKKMCLLATAACTARGLPEDWVELEQLRQFRDATLAQTAAGRADIARYYALAPGVVDAIAAAPDAPAILDAIYRTYVVPAAAMAASGRAAEAAALFQRLLARMETVDFSNLLGNPSEKMLFF